MSLLEVNGITKQYGGLTALDDVSINVESGVIHGLIGPNGAGKSTLFKVIAGFTHPTAGEIIFDNDDITKLTPDRIAKIGIIRTFQQTTLFQELTVLENVLIGTHKSAATNIFSAILNLDKQKQDRAMTRTMEVLDFLELLDRKDQLAAELPLGSKRALVIAVALAAQPRLLLLDEPFAGMIPEETKHMMGLTNKLRESGITIVLVEHDMKAVMGLCDELTVLNFGSVLARGTPKEVRANPQVISAYLGGGEKQ